MNKKATIQDVVGIALILLCAFVLLMIVSPGFKQLFLGFMSIFSKYEKSDISNSTYFAMTAESVGITATDNACLSVNNVWTCEIREGNSMGQTYNIYPVINIFVNVHNGGTKMRTVYAKPIVGLECNSISECKKRDFKQSSKRCSIAPGQTVACALADPYTFKEEGTYTIYPGYMCDVTTTDGCYEPGSTKAVESYNGKNQILVKVTKK